MPLQYSICISFGVFTELIVYYLKIYIKKREGGIILKLKNKLIAISIIAMSLFAVTGCSNNKSTNENDYERNAT